MRKLLVLTVVSLWGFISLPATADEIQLQDNPPERYVVVKGDTLWDISGRFLKQPWRWPEIWGMNREQIKDPHWIYPGDVIVLDKSGATPQLRLLKGKKHDAAERETPPGTVKLSPKVRIEEAHAGAIPSISPADIEPFLSKPLVTSEAGLAKSPYIVAAEESRVILGTGNKAYVRGIKAQDGAFWQIYRAGKALVDPDSGETLGYEAIYLGDATVTHAGEPATILITKAVQEINTGDRLLPPPDQVFNTYVPHAPEKTIKGRVISIYGGVAEAGQNAIVTLSKGSRDGLENGNVLALYRHGDTVAALDGDKGTIKLPDERYGLVFVFRTFDRVSYALTVQANRPVKIQDVVQTP
jgi:hypothetical protein